jgi:two-component system LytT family response regulator
MSAQRPLVLIVEDEDLARERLVRLVSEHADFQLIGACRNGEEALAALQTEPADVVLLDIQMPGMDGMELLRRIGSHAPAPLVVLITAHSRFAVDAFAGQAVDYVLKPFESARLSQALEVARERLCAREAVSLTQRIRAVVENVPDMPSRQPGEASNRRLLVREGGRLRSLRDDQIDWIQADGRSCVVHCADKRYRIAGPLADLAKRLSNSFARVSRSALINVEKAAELHEMFKGDLVAVMKTGEQVAVSRRFRAQVLKRLGAFQRRISPR